MDKFIEFIQNSWVVGIVGGIISGLIVYFLTDRVLDSKRKNEHKRNISIANNMVLSTLRPFIANSGLPSEHQLNAIINSISRQYKVKVEEMKTVKEIYEDLILEITSNLYIPNNLKDEDINYLLTRIETNESKQEQSNLELSSRARKQDKTRNMVSILAGILSGIVTIFSTIFTSDFEKDSLIIKIAIIAILIVLIATIIILVLSQHKIKRQLYKNLYTNDFFKMTNCGPDLNTPYDEKMVFVNYFSQKE